MNIIPDKKEFKRIEVEGLTSLSGKVLDFWEKEFRAFSPLEKKGDRYYLYKDVLVILKIKQYFTVDRLNKNEILEKLSTDVKGKEILIDKKKNRQNEKNAIPKNVIPKKSKNIDEVTEGTVNANKDEFEVEKKAKTNKSLALVKKFKKASITTNNKKDKLKILKQDLLEILTILRNNDKSRD
jgi:DNA-binding transcriptional MerR regulator